MKFGSIHFINSLPVDWGIVSGAVPGACEIVRGVPSELNALMSSGRLDVSPVSALHFAENERSLAILPNFSISSRSGVQSVLLLSRFPWEKLDGKRIALTPKGKTTPALLQILLSEKLRIACEFETIALTSSQLEESGFAATLVIGDEALTALDQSRGFYVYDLAEEWTRWTGLPFVFAVWAVRRDYGDKHPDEVRGLCELLEKSRAWAAQNMEEIIREAQARTGLSPAALRRYFAALDHRFDDKLRAGMERYVELAQKREWNHVHID